MYALTGATGFERDLEAGSACPGELVSGVRRDEGQLLWSRILCDRREQGDALGAHGEPDRDVLDDHEGDDVSRIRRDRSTGSELQGGGM